MKLATLFGVIGVLNCLEQCDYSEEITVDCHTTYMDVGTSTEALTDECNDIFASQDEYKAGF